MTSLSTYEVAYPDIMHPLINEKQQLKEKYIRLLGHYVDLFLEGNDKSKSVYRLDSLCKILLNRPVAELPSFDEKAYKESFSSVNRTRFTPFRLFSYGSEDDYYHLRYIEKNISYKKILFVVNMMDSCDFEDDTTEEIVCNIKNHLCEIGFEDPIVCPMSAKAGVLIKKAVAGVELSDNDKKTCKTFITQFTDENLQLGKYYANMANDYKADDLLWQAFVSTGLPGFENLLYQYIREE